MDSADDRRITVSEDAARLIREKVADGTFPSAADVVDAAMQALERDADEKRLSWMKARIQASIDDPRPPVPIEEAFARVLDRLEGR